MFDKEIKWRTAAAFATGAVGLAQSFGFREPWMVAVAAVVGFIGGIVYDRLMFGVKDARMTEMLGQELDEFREAK